MNWSSLINTLVFVIGTFFSVLEAIHLSKYLSQRLPEHTTVKLEQFVNMAVRQVEQQNKTLSGHAKKQLATANVLKLHRLFRLPAPPSEAIDMAIEAACHQLTEDSPIS
jgi:hypothetical protein